MSGVCVFSVRSILFGMALSGQLFGQVNERFSFEDNMEGWESDAAMPQGQCHLSELYPECQSPGMVGVDRLAAIRRTGERAYDGSHSVKVTLDGGGDEGTAWIIHPFSVSPGLRYRVSLQFYIFGGPWPRIGYLGPTRPRGMLLANGPPLSDFTPVACLVPASSFWTQCNYVTEVTADSTGTIWAALGQWVNYEVSSTAYIDNVTVTTTPLTNDITTSILGMSPNSGNGSRAYPLFSFVFADAKGWQDLGVINILVNDVLKPANACYLAYVPTTDVLYLVNDAGRALLAGTKDKHTPRR